MCLNEFCNNDDDKRRRPGQRGGEDSNQPPADFPSTTLVQMLTVLQRMESTLNDILSVLMVTRFEAKTRLPKSQKKTTEAAAADDESIRRLRRLRDDAAGREL